MDRKEFVNYINKIRLQNKNKWYFIDITVNNKVINIKGYDTWLQIFRIDNDGINYCNPCDMKVTEYKEYLGSIYSNYINNVLERV